MLDQTAEANVHRIGATAEKFAVRHDTNRGISGYLAFKRAFDLIGAIALLVLTAFLGLLLLALNPVLNRGPLLFWQKRMGQDCKPFTMIKFRTMVPVDEIARHPQDGVEVARITRLGRFLRTTRLDELPQAINILRGEMSLIGPRPDYWNHAVHFLREIPGYRERHSAKPGISGLAQIRGGYVEGEAETRRKVKYDLFYVNNIGFIIDVFIFIRTFRVIALGSGAK